MSSSVLGSSERPVRVAIIGSGPSGFYAADALFKVEGLHVRCDVFDRLPMPYGLVRGGVAPDHQKMKNVTRVYEKIAADDRFRFFGNVKLGGDLTVEDLTEHYDQIVYAVGNEEARELGIRGEDLEGVCSATEFVYWYNGHPDYRDREFDLSKVRRVAVVGNGNVAIDVCRILIQDPERLASTDIADYALETLRASTVEEVLLLGRRGPAQAAFSPKEIKEIAGLEGVDLIMEPNAMELDPVSHQWLEGASAPKSATKNVAFLTEASKQEATGGRRLDCRFLVSPVELTGVDGVLTGVRLQLNRIFATDDGTPRPKGTNEHVDEEVQMIFKAIGYRGTPIPGVPFREDWGIIPNDEGRVTSEGETVAGQYVVGWAKRGPLGLIGTNSPDSKATVAKMVEDLPGAAAGPLPEGGAEAICNLLKSREVRYVTFAEWQKIDGLELQRGEASGQVRTKFTQVEEFLGALDSYGRNTTLPTSSE
ncbi:MAG: FAD-dependent oxidoreductase [Planctomycetota bacterium]|nr:FAD-dependent oxidoreductase [Planctomycetota bacterium]